MRERTSVLSFGKIVVSVLVLFLLTDEGQQLVGGSGLGSVSSCFFPLASPTH